MSDEISPLELLVAQLRGRGSITYSGPNIQWTLRCPLQVHMRVDSIAKNAGISRTDVIVGLVDVGLDFLEERLTESERDKLFRLSPEMAKVVRSAFGDLEDMEEAS